MAGVELAPAELAPVYAWLGLTGFHPDGLHGPKRRGIVERRTRSSVAEGGRYLGRALAAAYPPSREVRLQVLLRPQRLDDALWRQVYALLVQGGPIWQWDLIRSLALLTHADARIAQEEAVRLYRSWLRGVRDAEEVEKAFDAEAD